MLLPVLLPQHAGRGDDVVAGDGDGRVRPGGQRLLQQDRAGGRAERVQVAVIRRGEDDVVGDRGGAVRRGGELVVPPDLPGVLVDGDHLAGGVPDGGQKGGGALGHAL